MVPDPNMCHLIQNELIIQVDLPRFKLICNLKNSDDFKRIRSLEKTVSKRVYNCEKPPECNVEKRMTPEVFIIMTGASKHP